MIEHEHPLHDRVETKLKTNEDLYRSIVTAIADGVVVQDADSTILACNTSAETILGLSHDQITGRTSVDPQWRTIREDGSLFPGEDHPPMRTLRTGEAQSNVIMGVYQPNNVLRWISINCEPLWNTDKTRVDGVVTTFSDITERKRAEEQVRLIQVLAIEIGKAKDLDSALEVVLKTICQSQGFGIGEAWIPCVKENVLKCASVWHPDLKAEDGARPSQFDELRELNKQFVFAPGAGLPGRVWLSKEVEWQTDVSQLPEALFLRCSDAKRLGIKAAMGIPLLVDRDVLAVLVFFKFEAAARDNLLIESFTAVSAQLSWVLQRKQIGDSLRDNEQRLRLALDGSGDGLWDWNIGTGEIYLSPQWLEMLGYTTGDLPNQLDTWEQLIHPEDYPWVRDRLQDHLNDISIPYRFDYRLLSKTGDWKWIANYGKVVEWDEAGQPLRMAGVHRDINQNKQAELALQNSEAELRALFEAIHDLVLVRDIEGRCLKILSNRSRHSLEPPDQILDKTLHETMPQEQANHILGCIHRSLALEKTIACDYSLQIDGKTEWFSANVSPLSMYTVTLVIRNISKRKRLEQQLFQEKELAQVTLHSIGDAVITTDADGKIQYFNPVAELLTGWSQQKTCGLPLVEVFNLIHETTRERVNNPVETALAEGRIVELANHTLLICRDGREIPIEDSAAPIRDRNGNLIGAVLVFHDVTQTRRLTRQLSWQAAHDPLTKLVNRLEFERCVEQALKSAQTQDCTHALCYLDLDQFKIVNDTCGHGAGDELLRQVAALLQTQIRKTDVLARLGGDEFGVLLHQCPLPQALQIANGIRECIQSFRFTWQEQTFRISVSIGLIKVNADNESLSATLSSADAACYVAKNKGRNRIHICQTDDRELRQQRGEMQWATRISRALEEDSFRLYYQTIVSMTPVPTDGEHDEEHYEVLLRLRDETGNLVLPMAFIPAAERYGLMHLVDRWVIRTLFKTQGQHYRDIWNRQRQGPGGTCDFLVAINLSGASINDEQFIEFLHEQFALHQIPPQLICFEITETMAIANLTKAAQLIDELQSLGCRFALDDFGSGMSSFAYLKKLSVDFLKIDGEFIRNIVDDGVDEAMVEAMTRIGHIMGIKIVAEFVEDSKILDCIKTLGIDYAQGFGISKPLPLVQHATE
jgi:diguanylate cyclase (GGDEF)-like protein/PAS domain S-box-containing protein